MNRAARITRNTGETQIQLSLSLDGTGVGVIDTPIGFFNHMMEQFCKHGLFDLDIKATGDIHFDDHHLIEDVGIVLGQAFAAAIADKKGIARYGFFILPMDDALATVAADLSGRYSFGFRVEFAREKVGDMSTELMRHFWDAFAQNAKINLFIKSEYGLNDHHIAEGVFKAVSKALRVACAIDQRAANQLPSTKGAL
jgi:imidazoleglycerol-phosphate dehydratase